MCSPAEVVLVGLVVAACVMDVAVVVVSAADCCVIASDTVYYSNGERILYKAGASGTATAIACNTELSGSVSGDGGSALDAGCTDPKHVVVDSAANVFFADNSTTVRRVDASSGVIETVAVFDGPVVDYTVTSDGWIYAILSDGLDLWAVDTLSPNPANNTAVSVVNTQSSVGLAGYNATLSALCLSSEPGSVTIGANSSESAYLFDVNTATADVELLLSGPVTGTAPYGDGGSISSATLGVWDTLARHRSGDLYFTIRGQHAVRMWDVSEGTVVRVAGDYSDDGAKPSDGADADSASIAAPFFSVVNSRGLYLAERAPAPQRMAYAEGNVYSVWASGVKSGWSRFAAGCPTFDGVAPSVTATDPTHGSVYGVYSGNDVSVTFDECLWSGSVSAATVTLLCADGGSVSPVLSVSGSEGNLLSVSVGTSEWLEGDACNLSVSTGVADASGMGAATDTLLSFTVGPTDECFPSDPCLNGGVCVDGYRSFNCSCPENAWGDLCANTTLDCSDPTNGPFGSGCQNDGVCVTGIPYDAVFTCDCSGVDYEGPNCQTFIDDCADSPCGSLGVCTDYVRSYSCECENGFVGSTCSGTGPCGDGVVNDGEDCDDSNTADGDGCDSDCNVEFGYSCPDTGGRCSLDCDPECPSSETCSAVNFCRSKKTRTFVITVYGDYDDFAGSYGTTNKKAKIARQIAGLCGVSDVRVYLDRYFNDRDDTGVRFKLHGPSSSEPSPGFSAAIANMQTALDGGATIGSTQVYRVYEVKKGEEVTLWGEDRLNVMPALMACLGLVVVLGGSAATYAAIHSYKDDKERKARAKAADGGDAIEMAGV